MTSWAILQSSHNPWDYYDVLSGMILQRIPGFVLTPGRYVGAEDVVDDGEPFEEKMGRLTRKLGEQFVESVGLEGEIAGNLKNLGYRLKE